MRVISGMAKAGLRSVCILGGLIAVLAAVEALGCPTCKDGVNTTDPAGLNVARGYFYSILLMLAMPFTLAGSFAAYVWREMRRQKRLTESEMAAATAARELTAP